MLQATVLEFVVEGSALKIIQRLESEAPARSDDMTKVSAGSLYYLFR